MLKMSKSFVVRMVLWSGLILYLICDFFVFNGPINQEIRKMNPTDADKLAKAMDEGICAQVYNGPIYLSQVDRRVSEKLWRSGRDPEKIKEAEMKILRWVALDDLISEAIMRVKVRVNIEDARVSTAEVDAEVARFEKRFESPGELDKAMAAQGIESREELRLRLNARLEQEKYVLSKIKTSTTVSDKESKLWYDEHKKELTTPERRSVRHIFLATLDHPSDEAKAKLQEKLNLIKAGKGKFPDIAKAVSEDARTKNTGGNLGWMRKDRLPGDFAASAFLIAINTPTLVRTKLGWHIIEVTGIKEPELPSYEAMKEDIATAISNSRRQEAVDQYKHQLRLLNHDHVDIYKKVLE